MTSTSGEAMRKIKKKKHQEVKSQGYEPEKAKLGPKLKRKTIDEGVPRRKNETPENEFRRSKKGPS